MNTLNRYTITANLFTIFNGLSGVLGIIVAIFYHETLPYVPFQLMIFGEIFDFLDGFLAKRAPSPSKFGVYADSVSDVITFAILPGIMLLKTNLLGTNETGIFIFFFFFIAGFYTISGWIRLIRFASNPTSVYFEGLPSPAAALLIGASATISTINELPWFFGEDGLLLSLIAISSGILMVLVINYPTPKRGQNADLTLIGIAGIAVISYLVLPGIFLLSIILFISLFYTIVGPLYLKYTSRS
ncbi:MAG: CDP-alcohol phosphatidyltransferase family protein [Candidatus Hodarchaeales archaeon]